MKGSTQKIIIAVSLLTLLILGISPKIIGAGIQDATLRSLLDLIPAETETQFEIHQLEVNNGWFSSNAEIEILYTPLGTNSIALQLKFEISHGPLLLTPDGPKLGLAYASITPDIRNDAFELAIADFPFALPDVTLGLLTGFDRSVLIGLSIAPLNYNDVDGDVNFSGLNANFNARPDQSAEFGLHMVELTASENSTNTNLTITGMEMLGTTTKLTDILAQSEAQLTIRAISSDAPTAFSVTELSSAYGLLESGLDSAQRDIFLNLEIAEIASDLPVASLIWNSKVEEISSELFGQYYTLLNDLQSEMQSNPQVLNTKKNQLAQELLLIGLQNNLAFNNFVKTNAYDGNHELDLRIHWNGLADLDNIARMDVNAALNALTVELDASLDLEAIMRSPAADLVAPYVQQGYLEIDNGQILINGTLKKGVLVINEDKISLDQFFPNNSAAISN
ncbi:MAG: DUF945 family protein [Pseudohongiella sp.]|nr:DUF945 family protein [Pseudohongiella sp.]